jgi:membrane protein implicated in regulation of membrane protease activity
VWADRFTHSLRLAYPLFPSPVLPCSFRLSLPKKSKLLRKISIFWGKIANLKTFWTIWKAQFENSIYARRVYLNDAVEIELTLLALLPIEADAFQLASLEGESVVNLLELALNQPAHILWLLGGLMFLAMGMLVGEPSIAALGFAAFITAIAALSVSDFATQLLIWGVLSVSLAVLLRGMVPRESRELRHSVEAEVVDVIPQGGFGHVIYEGSLWKARCQFSDVAIHVGHKVQVVGRDGNTLIVVPGNFTDHDIYDRTV